MSERDDWPVDDLQGLAQRLPEFDVRTYYDEQAQRAYEGALLRCPVLARLLGLPGVDKPGTTGATSSTGRVNDACEKP